MDHEFLESVCPEIQSSQTPEEGRGWRFRFPGAETVLRIVAGRGTLCPTSDTLVRLAFRRLLDDTLKSSTTSLETLLGPDRVPGVISAATEGAVAR